jgi:hypothetical protein
MLDLDKNKIGAIEKPLKQSGFVTLGLGCFTLVGVLFSLMTIIFLIVFLTGAMSINDVFNQIGSIFNRPVVAQVNTSRTIVTSLQPLGQLVSLSVELAQADINVTVNAGAMNLCGHSANHVAQGVIEAGVDITKITEDSVSYDEASNTYTITLPAP